jgi:hypothetical protein
MAAGSSATAKTAAFELAGVKAFFMGPTCSTHVEMQFESDDASVFNEQTSPASRLMDNAARTLSRSCASLERITSKGVVNGRVLYNGIAEAATKWRLTQLGVRGSGGLIGGAGGDAQQAEFGTADTFLALPAAARDIVGPTFCAEPEGGTCSGETAFAEASAGAYAVKARYLLDEDGSEARLDYTATPNPDGFLCNRTANIGIGVQGGALTPEGRAEYAQMLRERIESSGDVVCAGFRRGAAMLEMATFDAEGRSMGDPAALQRATAPVALRLDE